MKSGTGKSNKSFSAILKSRMFVSGFFYSNPIEMKKIIKYSLRVILMLFILLNVVTAFHAYKFTHFYDATEAKFKREAEKTKWDITSDMFFGINAVKGKNKMIPDSTCKRFPCFTKDNINIEGWYFKTSSCKGNGDIISWTWWY
jgi:hypothetical protein